jgi:hypothetical protein
MLDKTSRRSRELSIVRERLEANAKRIPPTITTRYQIPSMDRHSVRICSADISSDSVPTARRLGGRSCNHSRLSHPKLKQYRRFRRFVTQGRSVSSDQTQPQVTYTLQPKTSRLDTGHLLGFTLERALFQQ